MNEASALRGRRMVVALVGIALMYAVPSAQERKFYPDDPLLVDNDRLDVPAEPAEISLSDMFDRFGHIMADLGDATLGEAQNVNTLDEVPDSSWFTNRHGVRRMSRDALVRGPDTIEGPDMSVPWRVFRSKIGGLTPGFQILDGRGDRYVIKFDPVRIPELSSAAKVIATKLFYAIGYNTPENYVVVIDPDAGLTIEPGTMLEDEFGDESALTPAELRRRLRVVPRLDDGRVRVTASRYLGGRPLGPFRYYGTRSDDPNDVIPHENRRELRGLRLFAAWTNHDDTRAHNTQDSWVEQDGGHYIRHHLLDFGSTFGSGSVDLQLPNLGYHYWLDMDEVRRNLVSFGFHTPKYRTVRWPNFPEYEAVGRWESESYEPHEWKNDYPNPAFVRMTDRDAFWAAKIIMRFTPEELLAIVQTGQLSDPEQERYFHQVLVDRQHKSARHYMSQVNPLDEFQVTAAGLRFSNLSERYGFADAGTTYEVAWSVFDNDAGTTRALRDTVSRTDTLLPLPASAALTGDSYLMAEIRSLHDAFPAWNAPVRVYLRPQDGTFDVVGIER